MAVTFSDNGVIVRGSSSMVPNYYLINSVCGTISFNKDYVQFNSGENGIVATGNSIDLSNYANSLEFSLGISLNDKSKLMYIVNRYVSSSRLFFLTSENNTLNLGVVNNTGDDVPSVTTFSNNAIDYSQMLINIKYLKQLNTLVLTINGTEYYNNPLNYTPKITQWLPAIGYSTLGTCYLSSNNRIFYDYTWFKVDNNIAWKMQIPAD